MNTASQLDINWPHPRGKCVSVSHITVVTSGVTMSQHSGLLSSQSMGSRSQLHPDWGGSRGLISGLSWFWGMQQPVVCTHCAVHPYCCHCTHCTGNTCDHRLHCTLYTTNNTRLVTLRFTHWLRFPSLRLHASDNDDHWAIKRKSHTGFTFLWRQ